MYGVLNGLVNMNKSMNLQTSMSAVVVRVRIEGRVTILKARTTACADKVSVATIATLVGVRYVYKMFNKLEEYYIKTRILITQLIHFDSHRCG